jgi:glycosyltransferase involved in cell wall biosynthesis
LKEVAFVHVTEPGFSAGGAEIRTTKLFAAVHKILGGSTLTVVAGQRHSPWSPQRITAVARGTPPRLTQLYNDSTVQEVNRVVARAGVTIASTTFTAALVEQKRLGTVVLDAHNLEWRVNGQLARGSDGIIRKMAYGATTDWMKRFESKLARSAAGVWAVSPEEAEWFDSMGVAVWVVRNGVEVPVSPPAPSPTHDMLFVGSLNSRFNRQGIEWFCESVLPLIRVEVPDARLAVVGAGPPLKPARNVAQLGFVEDLSPVYSQARLCVAPLLSGAGTRLKVLEAMAHSRPVVSTSIGAEGLDVSVTDGVVIADENQDFAEACIAILKDDAGTVELGARARSKASLFSWDRIAEVAAESIRELSGT